MPPAATFQRLFGRERRPGDLVFAVVLLFFALVLLWHLPSETRWLKRRSLFAQPSFWPAVAVFGMVFFSAFHLLGSFASPRIEGRWREVWFWLRSLEYAGWFLGYVLLAPWLGYLPSTVGFAVALTLRAGSRKPRMLLAAAASAIAIVVLFRTVLQVRIPAGALYALLPDGLRLFAQSYL